MVLLRLQCPSTTLIINTIMTSPPVVLNSLLQTLGRGMKIDKITMTNVRVHYVVYFSKNKTICFCFPPPPLTDGLTKQQKQTKTKSLLATATVSFQQLLFFKNEISHAENRHSPNIHPASQPSAINIRHEDLCRFCLTGSSHQGRCNSNRYVPMLFHLPL